MTYNESELLRTPKTIWEPDTRLEKLTGPRILEDLHNDLTPYALQPTVPKDVFIAFETARNLYLYSHFVYRFTVVASLQAFTALEFALREKAVEVEVPKCIGSKNKEVPITLHGYLYLAIKRGWITDSILGMEASQRNPYCKQLMVSLPKLRNRLGHGSSLLYPQPQALSILKITSKIINTVYAT